MIGSAKNRVYTIRLKCFLIPQIISTSKFNKLTLLLERILPYFYLRLFPPKGEKIRL